MLKQIQQDTEKRMKKSLDALVNELSKIRTGRAHPSLIEHVAVLYYGNETPLSQVASITVEDARTLSISPWDKSMLAAIDKAIRAADLGLNPSTTGNIIRVPLPPLTEERRRELVKMVKAIGEDAKVAIRNIRRDSNNAVKDLLKKKTITEDEERKSEDTIQKLTDKSVSEVEKMLTTKEADLMQV